jgi:subfamily B ATP-binding cassette protein MsbA
LAFGLTGLACLLNIPTPLLVQGLVDDVAASGAGSLPFYIAALLGVFALQAVVGVANTHAAGRVGLEVVRDLRHRLYARLQRVGLSYYDKTPAGSILSRLMDDVAAVQTLVSGQTVAVMTDAGTALVVSALLLLLSPWLFLVVFAFLPVYVLSFRWFGRRIRAGAAEVRDRLDTVFSHLKAKCDGVLVVKACAREEAEMSEFAAQIDAAHAPRVRVERLNAALSTLTLAVSGVGSTLVFAAAALLVIHGRLTPGEVVAATALAALLFGPASRLAELASVFQAAGASVDRLGEILDQESDIPEPDNPLPLTRARGLVEFDRVTFAYRAGRPVLHDIRLTVEPGMKVALVGPTGCGKSTLLSLLMRFYDPTWGEIRLDGKPLRRLALADLRRQMGVVPQEAVIFRASLAENIRYGAPDADGARVEAAARAALVHGFATQLPQGYETVVGEGGHRLSQGERQRVAIARALCKDPALVVLDEATSALDTASEALLQAALASLMRGRTAFLIAHRLATILDADLIVVIQNGQIIQTGTHAELLGQLRSNLTYARPGASAAVVRRAVEVADLAGLIESLPEGLDTRVGERGFSLSGGQRQRLALARALVANPTVLLLDDCTSALDAETEVRIQAALEEFLPDCTCVAVSHKVSSVRHCDLIVVLHQGRVVERGTHDELLARGGRYAEAFRLQTRSLAV